MQRLEMTIQAGNPQWVNMAMVNGTNEVNDSWNSQSCTTYPFATQDSNKNQTGNGHGNHQMDHTTT
jgi:hypothetical protein